VRSRGVVGCMMLIIVRVLLRRVATMPCAREQAAIPSARQERFDLS
jgi:hypothetical protein